MSYDVKSCLKRSGEFRMYVFTLEGSVCSLSIRNSWVYKFCKHQVLVSENISLYGVYFKQALLPQFIESNRDQIKSQPYFLNTFVLDHSRLSYKWLMHLNFIILFSFSLDLHSFLWRKRKRFGSWTKYSGILPNSTSEITNVNWRIKE